MKREFSAGGIVFNSQNQVLLIEHAAKNLTKIYWGFPKGLIEEAEKSEAAALREVREESGVVAEIGQKVGDYKYVYTWLGQKIFKVVTFYLMNYLSGDLKDHDTEVLQAVWFAPEEGLKKLSFSNDKKLLEKALKLKNLEIGR